MPPDELASVVTIDELDSSATTMRLVLLINTYIPEGAAFPTGAAFDPSSEEVEDASTTGKPVRVSVWDRSRTTVRQAMAMRSRNDVRAYQLAVVDVAAVREECKAPRLRVVRDMDPSVTGPGSAGHCGVEGLDRKAGAPRLESRSLRIALAKRLIEIGQPDQYG